MIIVKTNNGDRFINEAETLQVSHNKDKALVEVWPSRWGNQQQQPQYYIIEHVESVIYTNADQTVKYEDKGSEVEKLKKRIEDGYIFSKDIQSKYISMYDEYIGMQNEIARLRAKLRDFGCEL
jgi:hypothetical protein